MNFNPSYRKVVQELESRTVMPERPPSLLPTKQGLARILHPSQFKPKTTLVVAGTNGKGSVCALLEALLLSAGKTVGLFTSPHLEETTERFRIGGVDVSQDAFCAAYAEVAQKTEDLGLSHFETLTLMAAWLFFSGQLFPPLEYTIFEVGLGGLWDSTNAIPHIPCIITALGYDHQNLLGNTLVEIAANKFGIVQPQARVVHAPFPKETEASHLALCQLARQVQQKTHSHWREREPFELKVIPGENLPGIKREPQFTLRTAWGEAPLSLPGTRAAENASTALTMFHELGFPPQDHLQALQNVRWPGRMEKVADESPCSIYLSGDHNPPGIESLIELLQYYPRRHLHVMLGLGKDKDLEGVLAPLFRLPDTSISLTETPFRGRRLTEYGPWLQQAKNNDPQPLALLRNIQSQAKPEDLIVITGSLYLVGFLRSQTI
ncbi:MAG: bifunctional folylpolyglutamate synthase/dihydrofolate synthase [Bdellovibrionia bacterium]